MAKSKGVRLFLIDGNTDEVMESYPPSSLAQALRVARTEGCQVVIASSVAEAEDIAAGAQDGPMFWPGKARHARKRRRTSRR